MFDKKKIFIALILVSGFHIALLAQNQKIPAAMKGHDLGYSFYIIKDINSDGNNEVLKGSIVDLKNNTYWVKNGTLTSENGENIIIFDNELLVNNLKAIEQVPAYNGYIVEFVKDKKDKTLIFLWIANEFGQRNSDELIIDIINR